MTALIVVRPDLMAMGQVSNLPAWRRGSLVVGFRRLYGKLETCPTFADF